jgi:hypothetical protein
MESSWLTFFILGGIAGALSLIWQVTNSLLERYRKPRLKCLERDIFNVEGYLDRPGTVRFITLPIQNIGRKSALGCVARATAIPLSGQGSRQEVSLHWADTPFPNSDVAVPVSIAPNDKRRLDVVFSRIGGPLRCLASPRALYGYFSEDAELGQGEYKLEIRVACEDGAVAESTLRLCSSQTWDDLNASRISPDRVVEPKKPESTNAVEVATRWGLVVLAAFAALGALLRMFAPGTTYLPERQDQTTLLYLGVAGGLLLLRQVKTFSLGQIKLEMIEKLREQQQKQEEQIANISLILPLLLQDKEISHIRNLFVRQTENYQGNGALRAELRRLRSIGLISMKPDQRIGYLYDGRVFDLADWTELTDLGRRWAHLIQEIPPEIGP